MLRTVFCGLLLVLLAGCSGSTVGPQTTCKMTLAGYSALTMGTSYARAVAIIGCPGIEMSSGDVAGYKTVIYGWAGSGGLGANANAMFQNDALITKAQMSLE